MTCESEVRRLPLHPFHEEAGARFIQFAGWEVPVYFTSIIEEHLCVRENAGLFDISHMGEFRIRGANAKKFLDNLLPGRIHNLEPGKALYCPMLNERGGIVDDLLVYELAEDHFLLIVNAANIQNDFDWIQSKVRAGVELLNLSSGRGILAIQGPQSPKVIEKIFGPSSTTLSSFTFTPASLQGQNVIVSRTGYTGEDGFELFYDSELAPTLFRAVKQAGEPLGMKPIGFGARDTLRLEARLLLHGHDMNETISPLEAGLAWTLDLDKPDFVGKQALLGEKEKGIRRKLVGFEMLDRGLARGEYRVWKEGKDVGIVTSGTFGPSVKKNIGLALIQSDLAKEGTELEIPIRNQPHKAKIVKTPFYRRRP